MDGNSYTFEYTPAAIHHGPGIVSDLESELDRHDLSRALIVTDGTLSNISAVMDPVEAGLGTTYIETCDAVTPEKYLKSAYDGAVLVRDHDIDALVPVGGGSSIDIAKQISVLVGHDAPLDRVADEFLDQGVRAPSDDVELLDIFPVPTTLPGADLSQVAGVKLSLDPEATPNAEIASGGISDARLMPTGVFHDLDLFATTPERVLARSAMNGFDKGIEMLYTRYHNPITDGIAIRGVRLLHDNLPNITADTTSEADLSRILQGIAAAQYGLSTPRHYRASIIHAFGHAIARKYQVQQGVAHAIAAPHVLHYVFDQIDGRREILAEAFDVETKGVSDREIADGIVSAVEDTRDALELPDQLRAVDGTDRSHFPELAHAVIEDSFMPAAPRELDARQADIESVFEEMW